MISDGSIDEEFDAWNDSEISITGGSVGNFFTARAGSTVNLSGGTIGEYFNVWGDSVVNVFGGSVSDHFTAREGSTVNISGGSIGEAFYVAAGSTVNLFGTEFLLNEIPITELQLGAPLTINDRNDRLTGVLQDGSPFEFYLYTSSFGHDFFHPGATLTVTLVPPATPEPASWLLLVVGMMALTSQREAHASNRSTRNRFCTR